jgi:hypothetical protein
MINGGRTSHKVENALKREAEPHPRNPDGQVSVAVGKELRDRRPGEHKEDSVAWLLKRPIGRPSHEVRRYYASFSFRAGSWTMPRRVVAKVEWHPGELYPRLGFIVTNMTRPAERAVTFYNQRGTAEQWIKEGKNAVAWTRLSCRRFAANAVRLQLHALAYNLANFLRTLRFAEQLHRSCRGCRTRGSLSMAGTLEPLCASSLFLMSSSLFATAAVRTAESVNTQRPPCWSRRAHSDIVIGRLEYCQKQSPNRNCQPVRINLKGDNRMPDFTNDPIVSRTNLAKPEFSGGVYGESTIFNGVRGVSYAPGHGAVVGVSENHTPQAGPGVLGQSDGTGVWGVSTNWMGVYGNTQSTTGGAGVMGEATGPGAGVVGKSKDGAGVWGTSENFEAIHAETNSPVTAAVAAYNLNSNGTGAAIFAEHKGKGEAIHAETNSPLTAAVAAYNLNPNGTGAAVFAEHKGKGEAIHAETNSPGTAAVAAYNLNPNGTGAAVFGKKVGNIGFAGFFDGDVYVTGTLTMDQDVVLRNGDCAEEFTVAEGEQALPGTVMVMDDDGFAVCCTTPYDGRAIGVVSGAGDFRPALLLDRQGGSARRPIALMGKVFCRVDADRGAIRPGDLLTTSSTPGHAMRARDPTRAFGATIGKALAALDVGCGMIPILAILQ